MFYRTFLILILGLASALPQATISDGPAGKTFKAWLEAFNSGDRAQMETYCHTYDPRQTADGMMSFRNMTGGFEVLRVLKSERLHLEFLVNQPDNDTRALRSFHVQDPHPPDVIQFGL